MTDQFHVYVFDNFVDNNSDIIYYEKLLKMMNDDSFNKDVNISSKLILLFDNIINNNQSSIELTSFINDLKKYSESSKMEIDIPDEFLDPLSYDEIKDPVVIPGSNVIMDKSIILKHLFYKEEDPFSTNILTISELNEYNENENIKSRCQNFLKRLEEWKKVNIL